MSRDGRNRAIVIFNSADQQFSEAMETQAENAFSRSGWCMLEHLLLLAHIGVSSREGFGLDFGWRLTFTKVAPFVNLTCHLLKLIDLLWIVDGYVWQSA